jgi:hypothetical protein
MRRQFIPKQFAHGEFMKTKPRQNLRRFQLNIYGYSNSYCIERIPQLERALAKKPRALQIDLMGVGEIPADSVLWIRSILMNRSPETQIITNARSSLQNAAVLIWLLGDRRLIRNDARLFFRHTTLTESGEAKANEVWKESEFQFDCSSDIEPEEGDYAKVLQSINEFLPVKELAGKFIHAPVLRQFGLVENEKVDGFLATVFGKSEMALTTR